MRIQDTCAFLVVTSRHSKRWIFPKGRIDPGEEPWEAALREAYEEAGVRGRISRLPAGFHVQQRPESGSAAVQVRMYALEVTEQLDDWPERSQRERHWATLAELRAVLNDDALLKLARTASRTSRPAGDG